jgi:hypothetical protein
MTTAIALNDEVLEPAKKQQIESSFNYKNAEITVCQNIYEGILNMEISQETCLAAGELRKRYVKIRTGIDKIHKAEKHFYLQAGKYVDAYKNKLMAPLTEIEKTLEEIENHFVNLEKERLENLRKERTAELMQYAENVPYGLETMDETTYQYLLKGTKEDKEKRDLEQKAEIHRKKIEARKHEFQPYMYLVTGDIDLDIEDQEWYDLKSEYFNKHNEEQKRLRDVAAKAQKAAQKAIDENNALKKKNDILQKEVGYNSFAVPSKNVKSSKEILAWIEMFKLPEDPVQNEVTAEIKRRHESFIVWAKSLTT